jgi:hypothetical protein
MAPRRPRTKTTGRTGGRPSSGVGGTRQTRGRNNEGPEGHKRRKEDAEQKSKNSAGIGAAAGLTLAAAAALGAAALAKFASSDGAEIEFTNITAEKSTDSFVPDFFTDLLSSFSPPTNIEITWKFKSNPKNPLAIASAVRVIKGDEIEMKDLPAPLQGLNGTSPTVIKKKGDNVFVVATKLKDTSNVNIVNQGSGTIHTNFEDQLDETIADTAGGIANTLGRVGGNFMDHIGTFIFLVVFCVALFYFIKFVSSFKSSSNNGNVGNSKNN